MGILFSIVIPTYNQAGFLSRCLESMAQLRFMPHAYEIIVVNDGATDDTPQVCAVWQAKIPQLQVICQENQGPAAARNTGIAHAQGEWIAFIDSDCLVTPQWLEAFSNTLQNYPEAVGIEGQTVAASPDYTILDHYIENRTGGYYWTCNMVYKAAVLKQIGGFDAVFRQAFAEDIDIAIRVKALGSIVFAPEALVKHLIVPRSLKRHLLMGRMFPWIIRLWKKHPGYLIPADKGFSALALFQLRQILVPIYYLRGWSYKAPRVYFLFCLIQLMVALDTLWQLPYYYRLSQRRLLPPAIMSNCPSNLL